MSKLLLPENLRTFVLPVIAEPTHYKWASSIIDNYETELARGFPGAKMEEAAECPSPGSVEGSSMRLGDPQPQPCTSRS